MREYLKKIKYEFASINFLFIFFCFIFNYSQISYLKYKELINDIYIFIFYSIATVFFVMILENFVFKNKKWINVLISTTILYISFYTNFAYFLNITIANIINLNAILRIIFYFLIIGLIYLIIYSEKSRRIIKLIFLLNIFIYMYHTFENSKNISNRHIINKYNIDTSKNVILIVFDEYGSDIELKKDFNYTNNLTSELKKWPIIKEKKAFSNFLQTNLSLNYFLNIDSSIVLNNLNFNLKKIYNSSIFELYKKNGYKIYNNSIFPIASSDILNIKTPALFLTKNLFYSTLFNKDFFLSIELYTPKIILNWAIKHNIINQKSLLTSRYKARINYLTNEVQHNLENKERYFAYYHYIIPHSPFILNKNGDLKDEKQWINPNKENYLDNIHNSNKLIIEIVSSFFKSKAKENTILIIMGDHKFRHGVIPNNPKQKNGVLMLYYHPSKNIDTNINNTKIILNNLIFKL